MPVDRTVAEDLTSTLVDLYAEVERRIAADIARRLAAGMESPTWADDKLQALGVVRRWTETLLARLGGEAAARVEQALILAYIRGGQAALEEVATLQLTTAERLAIGNQVESMSRLAALAAARSSALQRELAAARQALPGLDALQRLAFSLSAKLKGTHLRVLRWALDAYRDVIATTAAPDVLLGVKTRRRAAQVAWERLLSQGITGFVDRSGRQWGLASYVEMATRTTVAQAAVEGHLDRLAGVGLDLVIVSNAPQECERCRPWEGRVLARRGEGRRTVRLEHAVEDGRAVDVEVAGSVDDAVRAGLMHPNCRHSLSAYLPGVTKPPTHTADPQGDADRRRLRELERQVRRWKLRQAAAIDPAARTDAATRVRTGQAAIRAHIAATGLHRQSAREQVGVAR